jgi:glycosyltransferase involved in cell wall biosynthesis
MKRKKILFLTTLFPDENKKWYCVFIKHLAAGLSKLDCDVTVLVLKNSNKESVTTTETNNFKVIYYNKKYDKIDSRIPYYNQHKYRRIIKIINNYIDLKNIDVLHIHFFDLSLLKLSNLIIKYYKPKIFIHFHGLMIKYKSIKSMILEWLKFPITRKIIKNADVLIGVSNKVSNELRSKFKNKKVHTIYNGVDTKLFYPDDNINSGNNISIACIGNLIESKGQYYLINALKKCSNSLPGYKIKLKIIGTGVKEDDYKELVNFLGLEKNISFYQEMEQPKIAELLRKTDIFILPSYFEALGCVYLEAMASGTATIGCRGQGIEEIIIDGINGMLVRPKDIEDIEKVIKFLVINKKKRLEVAKRGFSAVTLHYTWTRSAKELNKLYEKVLED